MVNVLDATINEATVNFIVICFTGPIFGAVCGGIITSQAGGYTSRRGQLLQCFIAFLAVFFSLPIPFCNNIHLMIFFLWFLLFFGGFIQPQMVGVMLNSVEENKRMSANSIAQIAFNLLGFLPAPSFYGFVAQLREDKKSKLPMGCLIYSGIIAIIIFFFAMRIKFKRDKKMLE